MPRLIAELRVRTLLDLPCGDFHWMSRVPLDGVEYTGGDIVRELVRHNARTHRRPNVRFRRIDLLSDRLEAYDLVFSRDCLVHLSNEDAARALRNICRSGSRYLLTTTFTDRPTNVEIRTGQWRPINLEAEPFALPRPLRLVAEGCTEDGGIWPDKSLALWEVDALRRHLAV